MGIDGAARAVVVLLDSDVQRADGAADIGGGTRFTFEAIDAHGDETESTRRNSTAGKVTLFVVRPLESVPEFVRTVVQADRQVVLAKNAGYTRTNEVG